MSSTYEIKITGIVDDHWSDWFATASIKTVKGMSVLTCEVVDQAALYGLLRKVRDAGLELQSVTRIDVDDNTTSPTHNNE